MRGFGWWTGAACLLVAGVPALGQDATCELYAVERETTESRRCLSCHDGTIAVGRLGDGHHPVDFSYYEAVIRKRTPLSWTLARELVLVKGDLECTTCHDGRSGLPRSVATLQLCTACHVR